MWLSVVCDSPAASDLSSSLPVESVAESPDVSVTLRVCPPSSEEMEEILLTSSAVVTLVSALSRSPALYKAARSALDWADACADAASDRFVLSTEVMSDSMSSRRSSRSESIR